MQVSEIFHSIQGESTLAGEPCIFVRFVGCDLRCHYCDTTYAFHGGERLEQAQILAEVARHPARLVCLTGGEPVLQKELPQLAQALLDRGYTVTLETHGQLPLDHLPAGVRRIADLKTPGSAEPHRDLSVLAKLRAPDELKVVVCSAADFAWAVAAIDSIDLWGRLPILFSPAWGAVGPEELARWLLESGRPARLQLQLHKIIWGPAKRGV
jgi:7-carboxy-7-deazaguanine synthase